MVVIIAQSNNKEVYMEKIVNLTPHPIRVKIDDETEVVFPPSGTIPRVETIETPSEEIDGIPTVTRKLGQVVGLPDPQKGVFFLVSSLVFEASDRSDLLCPDTGKTCIRDGNGNIIAVTRLIKKGGKMKTTKRVIETTKRGLPAIWEGGGSRTNTGNSTIVAGANGEPLPPLYIRRRGTLACSVHALIGAFEGMVVIESDHHRRDFNIQVWRVIALQKENCECGGQETCSCQGRGWHWYAILEPIHRFTQGEWDVDPPEHLLPAIEAGQAKALCYHCREPHYITEG